MSTLVFGSYGVTGFYLRVDIHFTCVKLGVFLSKSFPLAANMLRERDFFYPPLLGLCFEEDNC